MGTFCGRNCVIAIIALWLLSLALMKRKYCCSDTSQSIALYVSWAHPGNCEFD
jgi:hypothetical protein